MEQSAQSIIEIGDKRTAAGPALDRDHPLFFEGAERFAQSHATGLKAFGHLAFGRQFMSRSEQTAKNRLPYLVRHSLMDTRPCEACDPKRSCQIRLCHVTPNLVVGRAGRL